MATRILTWLLAALFVFAGGMKLSGNPQAVQGFADFGFPPWFVYAVGLAEAAGGIALLVPRLAPIGLALLLAVMVGAFGTLVHAGQRPLPPLVVGALLLVVAWRRRAAARS